ncbi:hypothetical protein EVAR_22516_1 [Eumeta japonica]|uniref:Uncharacterized protein n=1 Tax=Eumeta variegata TaxID=151549 RepID=A0A4C1U805_EUMVA|nr:hypothetical protein EVAR_22516_1 [Eumeta japonica]
MAYMVVLKQISRFTSSTGQHFSNFSPSIPHNLFSIPFGLHDLRAGLVRSVIANGRSHDLLVEILYKVARGQDTDPGVVLPVPARGRLGVHGAGGRKGRAPGAVSRRALARVT